MARRLHGTGRKSRQSGKYIDQIYYDLQFFGKIFQFVE